MPHQIQIERIQQKLAEYLRAMPRLARPRPMTPEHLAEIESKFQYDLPEPFREFLLNIGVPAPCAGCGIDAPCVPYGLGTCELVPEMADWQRWQEHCDAKQGYEFQGLLAFESRGCSDQTCIVLNGPHRGRVVYIDAEFGIAPFWCHEESFLDWYERWLDEVALGFRFDRGYQFGEGPTGGEAEIFLWINDVSRSVAQRCEAISALCKLPVLQHPHWLSELIQYAPLAMRIMCCKVVGAFCLAEFLPELSTALAHPETALREASVRAVQNLLGAGLLPQQCIALLKLVVVNDLDGNVAALAASTFTAAPHASRDFALLTMKQNRHVEVTLTLSYKFSWQIEDEGLLIQLLSHTSPELQNSAAQGLLNLPPVALQAITAKLAEYRASGQCNYTSVHLLRAIKRFHLPEVAETLLQWLDSENDYCRIEAVTALIARGDIRVLHAALKMLDEARRPCFDGSYSSQLISEYVYLAATESPNRQLATQLIIPETRQNLGWWESLKSRWKLP